MLSYVLGFTGETEGHPRIPSCIPKSVPKRKHRWNAFISSRILLSLGALSPNPVSVYTACH